MIRRHKRWSWPRVQLGVEYFLLGHRDALYLVPNRCPHRGGPLKFGFINDDEAIVCPLHKGVFPIARLICQPSTIRLEGRQAAVQ